MKRRTGLVSNSSSSSFYIPTKSLNETQRKLITSYEFWAHVSGEDVNFFFIHDEADGKIEIEIMVDWALNDLGIVMGHLGIEYE